MAKLIISAEELVHIAVSSGLLPIEIARVRVKGEIVHFVIKTGAFILPFIPASLRYVSFDGDRAMFELTVVSSHANRAVAWLNERIKLEIPDYVKLEYPNVWVGMDGLLAEQDIKGVKVREVSFQDGEFTLVAGGS